MANKDLYKIFQLTDLFISKYEFNQIIVKNIDDYNKDETWLSNKDDKNYNLIRISFSSAGSYIYEKNHIEKYIEYMAKATNTKIKFLDIHINKDEYDKTYEDYDYINIDIDYAKGTDLTKVYPEIYKTLHYVENSNDEIVNIAHKLTNIVNKRIKPRIKKTIPYVTYILFAICCIVYALQNTLINHYSESSVMVFLGSEYKTFTIGLNQYWRLITNAFVHSGFMHFFCNTVSLLSLGTYAERRFGHLRFTIIMFVSILVGSLAQSILTQNSLILGISSGLYGIFICYIIDIFSYKVIDLGSFLPVIIINIGINFMSNTAFLSHLGGAVAGYLLYKIFNDSKRKDLIVLLVVMILCLIIKYVTIKTINPFYYATDLEVLQMYADTGKDVSKILEKLLAFYSKYGG